MRVLELQSGHLKTFDRMVSCIRFHSVIQLLHITWPQISCRGSIFFDMHIGQRSFAFPKDWFRFLCMMVDNFSSINPNSFPDKDSIHTKYRHTSFTVLASYSYSSMILRQCSISFVGETRNSCTCSVLRSLHPETVISSTSCFIL